MAITLVPMICPQCHATIEVPVEKSECFCTHCGTRILIDNDNVKTININQRITDDARIEEAKSRSRQDLNKVAVAASICAAVVVAIALIAVVIMQALRAGR